jgi:tetratricopeptide (TPR) repeat protein
VHRVARAVAPIATAAAEALPETSAPRPAKERFQRRIAKASPTLCLDRAMKAKTSALRVRHARAGLAAGPCDLDTQAMLLRQLYLGQLERGDWEAARVAAEQFVALQVMPDVARHDAARACQALGDLPAAVVHLRAAVSASPPERKTFHLSTLGSLLYVSGRAAEACEALTEALERDDPAAPLLRGQLALARFAAEADAAELDVAFHELLHDRTGEGYGRFVLGELAMARGDRRAAQLFLQAFLTKAKRARPAAQAALKPEIDRATAVLGRLTWN